ncbi:putative bifunctional diguanylate cyclase/phosphodiesterase [Sphingomonas bacterium]|uniref:putative bifunctional diguanylate cyclase/phosphodiesterase n=1 Tax=Sphingomonas bacterium TaxID=1895847 RepID=UPI00157524A2|nr:EAL domain-containing protein [Sphingomonas bacterium]
MAASLPADLPPRLASPAPRELSVAEGALDLLSIPAALVDCAHGALAFVATNHAFRAAGLGSGADRSMLVERLGERLLAFCRGGGGREEFAWAAGDRVDARHYRVTVARVHAGGTGRCLVSLIDQTCELRAEDSLRREMATDSLTGLPNRAGFGDRLDAMPQSSLARHAVMIVDLERFSRINACLGGMTGDELLISVARRLRGALRAGDVLARTGGDEFGILMAVEDAADPDHLAKRLRGALAHPFRLSDYEIRVSCAIGIALGAGCADDPDELIRNAQFAAKRGKTSGHTEAHRTDAFDAVREQFGIETALRRAIEQGQLRLTFQPICDLATGRIHAFESLARWTDEKGREHAPASFIAVAEESGLIVPLGRWALAEAARTLAGWDARSREDGGGGGDCGVRMAVNVSAIQFQRDSIAPAVEKALQDNGLAGDRLTLELTESALIADPDRIGRTLEHLRTLGTRLAMDDFGTGYSNLAYLQKLPIGTLKIDRSFVTGMLADPDKVAIVRAVLSLAQALGMSTVAEGVETIELGRTLAAMGCTYGQGYAYARPLEADEAYALVVARNGQFATAGLMAGL